MAESNTKSEKIRKFDTSLKGNSAVGNDLGSIEMSRLSVLNREHAGQDNEGKVLGPFQKS